MNLSRGLLRAWIVVSLPWVALCVVGAYEDYPRYQYRHRGFKNRSHPTFPTVRYRLRPLRVRMRMISLLAGSRAISRA
jgi:hypothetical protein